MEVMKELGNISRRLTASAVILATFLASIFALWKPGSAETNEVAAPTVPIKIGWIGPMTGPTAKYGSYQAALLAEEDINAQGGIGGRPLKLIFEDGKANGRDAVSAANYLINIERVHYIVGGHCTPETLPASSVAERNKVIMMAAVTSSPKVTTAGDYIFRVTAVNTQGLDKLLRYMASHLKGKRVGALYEETDYAEGLAEYFRDHAPDHGLQVLTYDGYAPGEQDFRGIVARIKRSGLDGLYLSPQAPDSAVLVVQKLGELGIKLRLSGNELAGNAFKANAQATALFEGILFAEPRFEQNSVKVQALKKRFKERFGLSELPYGMWTAESYDAVRVLAATIAECGDQVEKVKDCLYRTRNYPGVSGSVGFDQNGDGIREYVLKTVQNGEIVNVPEGS